MRLPWLGVALALLSGGCAAPRSQPGGAAGQPVDLSNPLPSVPIQTLDCRSSMTIASPFLLAITSR
ncbi:MAG: hypothetical protein KGS61_19835 [Verrucomicrobia bacterium]|nr:hypothetical protein [Verrucomicrobiota bacterium]